MTEINGGAGFIGRWMRRVAPTRFGAWMILSVFTYIDPVLLRLTKGRFCLSSLTGYPTGLLTTIGAKTGKERTTPLLMLRDDNNVVLIASYGGQPRHPGWYHNLKTNPKASILLPGATGNYIAYEAEGEERERLWQKAQLVYAGFDVYQTRTDGRIIPVMVLIPAET